MSVLRLLAVYVPRSLRRGGRRAVVTMGCITVGVAAVVALQVASLSVGDALTTNVRAANGGDIAVTSNAAPLSSADLATFRRLQAGGKIATWTAVSRIHATATTTAGLLIPFDANVVDPHTFPVGGQPVFVDPPGANLGQLLGGQGDVVISSVLAEELGARTGTLLTANGVGGSGLHARVRGVLAQASLEHAAVMDVRREDAVALTSAPPQYVAVYANVPGDPAATAAALRQAFPQAGVTTVSEAVQAAQQQVHDFHSYALVAGLVALLVAGVGIQNAMQSMLTSRVGEVAVLKSLGNPPLVVGALFTAEAAILGSLGGIAGSAVGIAASSLVTSAVARATGLQTSVHIDAGVALEGILLGIGATVLFSLLPIVGSVGVRPLVLLRGDLTPTRQSALRYSGLFICIVVLFAVLATLVTNDPPVAVGLVLGGVVGCGVLALLFAAAVAALARLRRPTRRWTAMLVALALASATAALVRAVSVSVIPVGLCALAVWIGVALGPARLQMWLLMAGRGLDRRRARAAVTLVALWSGAIAGGLTMTMASGLRDQIAQAIADNGSTNLVAVATQPSRDALLSRAGTLAGVQSSQATMIASGRAVAIDGAPLAAAPAPSGDAEPDEGRLRQLNGVTGYSLASGAQPPSVTVTRGRGLSAADAGTLNVLVDQSLTAEASLVPGSTVTLAETTTGNPVRLTVVGLYHRSGLRSQLTGRYSPRVLGDVAAAQRLAGGNVETVLSMTIAADRLDSDSVTLQRAVPSALVANVNDLTVVVRTTLDNLLLVLTAVTAMVVVAGISVVGNSVTLALIERAREVALLKAVGFGPWHVLSLVVLEYGLAGFLAAAAGVVSIAAALAILSAAVLQTPIAFSGGISAVLVVVSILVTATTSWVAARSGAWVRPLAALRNS